MLQTASCDYDELINQIMKIQHASLNLLCCQLRTTNDVEHNYLFTFDNERMGQHTN